MKFFGRFAALRGISYNFAARPALCHSRRQRRRQEHAAAHRRRTDGAQPGRLSVLGSSTLREVAQRVGYMGHAPLLYDELSGMENLRYFAGLYGIHDDDSLPQRDADGWTRS